MDISDIHEVLKISGAGEVMLLPNRIIAQKDNLQVSKCINTNSSKEVIEKKIIDLMPKHGECCIKTNQINCGKRTVDYKASQVNITPIQLNGFLSDSQTIDRKELDELLQVEYAVASDETRPILKGIHFDNDTVVALDGYRLAMRKSKNMNLDASFTVPAECIAAIRKTKSTKPVIMVFDDKYIKFVIDDIEIMARLMEGNYIAYKSLIPQEYKTSFKIEASRILDIINSYNKDTKLMKLFIQPDQINIEANIQKCNKKKIKNDKGKFETRYDYETLATIKDSLVTKVKGDSFEIAFNPKYLKDALKDKENVKMKFISPISPLIITEGNKLELVLPVRIFKGASTR